MSEPKFTIRYDSHGTQLTGPELTTAQHAAIIRLGFLFYPRGHYCEGQYSDYWQAGYSIPVGELEFILGPCAIQNESYDDYNDRQYNHNPALSDDPITESEYRRLSRASD